MPGPSSRRARAAWVTISATKRPAGIGLTGVCYIDAIDWLAPADRAKLFEGNVRKVYPRFAKR